MARRLMTDAERRILEVLWATGVPMTMMEITRALAPQTAWSKHTVTTLLKRMLEKGTVLMDATGPVRHYAPAVDLEAVAADQLRQMADRLYAGEAGELVRLLLERGCVTPEGLRRMADGAERQTMQGGRL